MHNPFVPETLEGWSLLHLMYRVRWDRLREMPPAERQRLADRKSTRLNSSHMSESRMPSSA